MVNNILTWNDHFLNVFNDGLRLLIDNFNLFNDFLNNWLCFFNDFFNNFSWVIWSIVSYTMISKIFME